MRSHLLLCSYQSRHRMAPERPISLLSWSTGNERGDEESKLDPRLLHMQLFWARKRKNEDKQRLVKRRSIRIRVPKNCPPIAGRKLLSLLYSPPTPPPPPPRTPTQSTSSSSFTPSELPVEVPNPFRYFEKPYCRNVLRLFKAPRKRENTCGNIT